MRAGDGSAWWLMRLAWWRTCRLLLPEGMSCRSSITRTQAELRRRYYLLQQQPLRQGFALDSMPRLIAEFPNGCSW